MAEENRNEAETLIIGIDSLGDYAVLQIGEITLPLKGYKISSSMQGRTELELNIEVDNEIMKFEISAS